MNPKLLIPLLLTLSVLTGCGQVVVFGHTVGAKQAAPDKIPLSSAAVEPASPAVHRVTAVTLELTPQVAEKVASDPRFDAGALREAVEGKLRARELFDAQGAGATATAEVLIDDFATRSTSNVVVFGYNLGAGTLAGDVRVRDANGNELGRFRIVAESRLAIAANGEDKNPLGALYRSFADLTADSLAGTPSKSRDTSGNVIPR